MKKVTDFLENYVQWVVLGLGVLWIGLMAWMFWSSPKAQVTVAGTVYTPGELDAAMNKGPGPVETLSKALQPNAPQVVINQKNATPTGRPSFVDQYATLLILKNTPPEIIPAITSGVSGGGMAPVADQTQNQNLAKGTLPKLDGAAVMIPIAGVDETGKPIAAVAGRSIVQIPDKTTLVDPLAPPAPAAGAEAAGGVAVAPVPAAPAVPAAPTEVELSWVTGSFNIKMDEINKAFTAAKIPPGTFFTAFLAVDVTREEQDSGGNWGKPVTIKPLANHIIPPLPAATDKIGQLRFREWALKATSEIIHPPFYVVTAGAPWRSVTMAPPADAAAPAAAAQNQPFDPANPPTDRALTTEEKGLVYQYKEKQRREAAKQKAEENRSKLPPP